MDKFIIGCNYWESKNGIDMWKNFNSNIVDEDFRHLSEIGVEYIRMFPNWREFQPVYTARRCKNVHSDYRTIDDELFDNDYLLDMKQIENFRVVCSIAEKYNIKLIVSILTGWMSGRVYYPPALENRNLISDPVCLQMEIRYVRGIVNNLKSEKVIYAWDLGNECNCLGNASNRFEAYLWTATIANAIKSEDNSRIIMSGMNGLSAEENSVWNIIDQAENTDVLCSHTYPSDIIGSDASPIDTMLPTLLPSAELEYYSGIGGKPAMMQEQGTFNDMVANKEMAAKFLTANIFSCYANGGLGYLWWCATDQKHLKNPPYGWSLCESELGLFENDYTPKPTAKALQHTSEVINKLNLDLPQKNIDAVVVAPRGVNHWNITSIAYSLAKQSGFEVKIREYRQKLLKSNIYILPSLVGSDAVGYDLFSQITDEVYNNGAILYISNFSAIFPSVEEVFGFKSFGRTYGDNDEIIFDEKKYGSLPIKFTSKFIIEPTTAKVLARDRSGNPVFLMNNYGKGKIYYLNFPLESYLSTQKGVFNEDEKTYCNIYKIFANDVLCKKPITKDNPLIGMTLHRINEWSYYAIAINYSPISQDIRIKVSEDWNVEVLYGDIHTVPSCQMCVFKVTKCNK